MAWFSPISQTKIIVPQRRKELLSRPRLLTLLDDLLDFKLIIIAAPAGYGKTSLMIDYATSYDWPIAWLAMDPLDQNLTRFLTYFISAIQQRFPSFGVRSNALMETLSEDQLDIDSIVTTITNDIFENITEHFILVLDDYHLVNQGKELDEFLSGFLQKVGENFHLVVTSRTLLTLPDLPLLVARSQVGGLSLEELVFQPDEIKKLFEKNHNVEISKEEAEAYARQSEGWITGLLLTAQVGNKGIGDQAKISRTSGIGLYEYLAQQVLDQQSPDIQQFLLRSSLLEEFNPEMCQLIIGEALQVAGNWQSSMEDIVFNNLFVVRIGDEGFWLRYHHLFRDFLQHRMETMYPEETRSILRKLAEYHTQSQDWEHAFVIYLKLGDIDTIIHLIESIGSSFISKGKIKRLENWFSDIPEEKLRSNPKLMSIKASIEVNKGNLPVGLDLLNAVIELQQKKGDDKVSIAENLVRRSTTLRLLGKYQESHQDAQQALRLSEEIQKSNSIKAEAMRAVGMTYYQEGILDEALTWMERSLALWQKSNSPEDCARIQAELGIIFETLGNFEEAEKAYNQSLQFWKQIGDSIWQSNLYNNLGVLQHARGDFENSFMNLEKAMDYAKMSSNRRMEGYSLASIGDLYRNLDAHQESLEAYSDAMKIAQDIEDQYLVLYLRLAETRIKILQKQFKQATTLLELAFNQAKRSGSQLEIEQCKVEKAILTYYFGDLSAALTMLLASLDFFKSMGQPDTIFTIKLYLAVVLAKQKMTEESAAIFQEIIHNLNQPSSNTHILSTCFDLRNDLKLLSGQAGIAEYIELILDQNANYQKKIQNIRRKIRRHASVVPFAEPKLVIRAFGKTEVYLNNKLLSTSDWMTQTSRDLFFLFLSNPEGMTKEEVGLILWPDSSMEELKRRFKNAIYRMRRAIGSNVVLFTDNYYHFNNAVDFEYDVLSFEQYIAQAENEKDAHKAIQLLESAVELYKGPFLSDVDATWFGIERQHYFDIYMNALLKLYTCYMNQKDLEKALQINRQIIQNDPSNEEAYCNAMSIYHALGNTAAIIRVFEQCKQQLAKEYGLEPSQNTIRHYQSFIQTKS
ncbi:MAG TPA: tetratricopeptide repeat protein [Anaerolineaceae bacterium]|nr:tetratricopeptide repeat protein [Anaerolineaceae bacterium]